ncbi:MAG: cytochrome c family protein [Myxococcota bacterium]
MGIARSRGITRVGFRWAALGIGILASAWLVVGATDASGKDHQYVGLKKCRSCHKKQLMGNQYGVWKKGPHAKALETLKTDKALEYAQEKGLEKAPHEADECLKCHVTGYGEPAERFSKGPLRKADGVQCESCHGPGKDYRKKKTMADRDKAVAKGLWEAGTDEQICLKCHNDESPGWDPERFTLADGRKTGFDFEQAKEKIRHPIPEDVKGHYIELEKKERAEKMAREEAVEEQDEEE